MVSLVNSTKCLKINTNPSQTFPHDERGRKTFPLILRGKYCPDTNTKDIIRKKNTDQHPLETQLQKPLKKQQQAKPIHT